MGSNKEKIGSLLQEVEKLIKLQKYEEAIECCDKLINLCNKKKDKSALLYSYNRKGLSYFNLHKYEEAIECHNKVIKLALGNDEEDKTQYDKMQEGDKTELLLAYLGKGSAFFILDQYEEAIEYFNKVIKFANEQDNKHLLIRAYSGKGFCLLSLKKNKEAQEAFQNYFKEITKTSQETQEKLKKEKILFRFRNLNQNMLNELINNQLYSSIPKTDFNDPFDCHYNFDIKEFNDEFEKVRISCFSVADDGKNKNPQENKLMWSYYAKGHEGICIEYELLDNAFKKDNLGFFAVKYKKDVPSFLEADAYCTKAPEWEHENEVRMIRYLDKKTSKPTLLDLKNNNVLKIKNIYLGIKSSDADKAKICKLVEKLDHLKKVGVFKMKKAENSSFAMYQEEIEIPVQKNNSNNDNQLEKIA